MKTPLAIPLVATAAKEPVVAGPAGIKPIDPTRDPLAPDHSAWPLSPELAGENIPIPNPGVLVQAHQQRLRPHLYPCNFNIGKSLDLVFCFFFSCKLHLHLKIDGLIFFSHHLLIQ